MLFVQENQPSQPQTRVAQKSEPLPNYQKMC